MSSKIKQQAEPTSPFLKKNKGDGDIEEDVTGKVKPAEERAKRMAAASFWFGVMCTASTVMTVGNKAIMRTWAYPNALLIIQQVISAMILGSGAYFGRFEVKPITKQHFKVFSVPSVILCIQIFTSLKAMPLVAIATMVVFRNMGTVAVVIIDRLTYGTKLNQFGWYAVILIVIGSQVYAGTDVNYNSEGYMWLVVNTIATVSNMFYNKHFISKTMDQTSAGISLVQTISTIPVLCTLAIFMGEVSEVADAGIPPTWVLFALLVTSFGGSVLSTAYASVYRLASPTTVTVAANFNKLISIIASCIAFGTVLELMQWFGLSLAMAGSLVYSIKK